MRRNEELNKLLITTQTLRRNETIILIYITGRRESCRARRRMVWIRGR